ncbi:MAG TPA: bi-domain-containing oxidoreductase [Longimicrobium sp.]|nr:bi-domain-containing oxidoreductase [Longimicrobium sp.]
MKQVLLRQGGVTVAEVPAPRCAPGTVLVRVDHSCISPGTELDGLRKGAVPLWRRAVADPAKLRRAVELVAREGAAGTVATVRAREAAEHPVGYSAAGEVVEVGEGVANFRVGDRVACVGNQFAHHAAVIRVPRTLVARVPDGVGFAAASTAALGAIALQGVRRATPTLGETFVVLGLGALGQLTAQLLRANGCRVIGIDPDGGRVERALGLGLHAGFADTDAADRVTRMTGGIGADGVIVTASSSSSEPLSSAFGMCRRKGRVVLVGDVGLEIDRSDIYAKELDFLVSTSYGPGRYDPDHEERGLDYPLPYVRWTEGRNVDAYLALLADGSVKVDGLIDSVFDVDGAADAYQALDSGSPRPMMVLLRYPAAPIPARRAVVNARATAGRAGRIRFAVIGAGSFARAVHLPTLRSLGDEVEIRAVANATGHGAHAAAREFGAAYATTDAREAIADAEVDAVLVCTRHDLHADLVVAALAAGKHVLVEKPLALNAAELERVRAAATEDGPILLTGFNRRFSPYSDRIAAVLAGRAGPLMASFRVNAGALPPSHWVHGPEGGGRNVGEACHFYDWLGWLTGARVTSVAAQRARHAHARETGDDFTASLAFDDGSVATLLYTALGSPLHPKERVEIFAEGRVLTLDDWRELTLSGARAPLLRSRAADKGHRAEMAAFVGAIRAGGAWPIPLWQQLQAMEIAFEVERQLAGFPSFPLSDAGPAPTFLTGS